MRESAPEVRTHHLHAYFPGAPDWEKYLVFRERLITSPELRSEYCSLKQELAKKHGEDRMAYTDAKTEFVKRVLSDR